MPSKASSPARRKRKSRPPAAKRDRTGRLRIGDQWNAITIIARSQTHPLKAICELTENAIDARSQHIQILRRRRKGKAFLEVLDDGQGVALTESGEPDFARIATHVCDSMKRHLQASQREGVHGEFGIGLLSFWSLGDELKIISAGDDGRLMEMRLVRGEPHYTVKAVRGELALGGTRVVVGPLLDTTRNLVTGEKIARFLATELRDRIRSTGVKVRVIDRISRRDLIVEPREFDGDRVSVPEAIQTPAGPIHVELYFRDEQRGGVGCVAVCKDGTRVLKDVTELIQFQHVPWSEGRLEGVLDYPQFELAPGTRGGIVPDENLQRFVAAITRLEPLLIEKIAERNQAESDKASRAILRQVHRAFVSALRDLPQSEYLFFDLPDAKHSLQPREGKNDTAGQDSPEGVPFDDLESNAATVEETLPTFIPIDPGPLAHVRIRPRHPRRRPGEPCLLSATAKDAYGAVIVECVEFMWSVQEGPGMLTPEGAEARVTQLHEGATKVEVRATSGNEIASDVVTVKFLESVDTAGDDGAKGLPSYRLEPEPRQAARSRYDATENEIIINSAHRDFISSRATAAMHRRYIGKLYAKEVVLINFPHESPSEVMERLIELTLRTEAVL